MDILGLADELLSAHETQLELSPPSRRDPHFRLEDGYAVGALVHEHRVESGWLPVGFKLGFTNQAIWGQLGLSSPFCSHVYAQTVHDVSDQNGVPLSRYVAPRIEPEIVVGLGSDVGADASADEVAAALAWAALGIEIVQCHYPNWDMKPADAIADAGLHAALLIGPRHQLDRDAANRLALAEVTLRRSGQEISRGHGSAALGGPVEALVWLLSLPGIDSLPAGTTVTTGTLTPAFPVVPGEVWQVNETDPEGLGAIEIHLTRS
jgi:2-oxo-3-hexenedioate decarboxylase